MGLLYLSSIVVDLSEGISVLQALVTQEDCSADRKGQLFRNLAIYMVSSPGGLDLEFTVKQNYGLVNWKPCGNDTAKASQLHRSVFISQFVRFLFFPVGTKFALVGGWVRKNTTVLGSCFIELTMTTCFGRARPSSGHGLIY